MTSVLSACKVTFSVSEDYETPKVLKHIEATVNHPEHGDIASLEAVHINRNRCRGIFLEVMDEHSDELLQFGTKLFNKNGQLRPWLVESDYHKGTGCWGFELNEGMLVYIISMDVKPAVSLFSVDMLCILTLCRDSCEIRVLDPGCLINSSHPRMLGPQTGSSVGHLRQTEFKIKASGQFSTPE
jgi:hypothetical protein